MSGINIITLFILVLTSVKGQDRCCAPDSYDVRAYTTTGMEGRQAQDKMIITDSYIPRLSLDYNRQLASVNELVWNGVTTMNITTIVDSNKGLSYVIIWNDNPPSCRKIKAPGPMKRQCVPKDAHFLAQVPLGYGENRLDCDSWYVQMKTQNPPSSIVVKGVLQREGCIPVMETTEGVVNGRQTTATALFYDFSPGIKDPSVFNVPKFCDNQTLSTDNPLSAVKTLFGHV